MAQTATTTTIKAPAKQSLAQAFDTLFSTTSSVDRSSHIEICFTLMKIGTGVELKITMGRRKETPVDGNWSVSQIFRIRPGSNPEQTFRHVRLDDNPGMMSIPICVEDDVVIAVCDSEYVYKVYPLSSMFRATYRRKYLGNVGNIPDLVRGGPSLADRVRLKMLVADMLKRKTEFTKHELKVIKREVERQQKLRLAA